MSEVPLYNLNPKSSTLNPELCGRVDLAPATTANRIKAAAQHTIEKVKKMRQHDVANAFTISGAKTNITEMTKVPTPRPSSSLLLSSLELSDTQSL